MNNDNKIYLESKKTFNSNSSSNSSSSSSSSFFSNDKYPTIEYTCDKPNDLFDIYKCSDKDLKSFLKTDFKQNYVVIFDKMQNTHVCFEKFNFCTSVVNLSREDPERNINTQIFNFYYFIYHMKKYLTNFFNITNSDSYITNMNKIYSNRKYPKTNSKPVALSGGAEVTFNQLGELFMNLPHVVLGSNKQQQLMIDFLNIIAPLKITGKKSEKEISNFVGNNVDKINNDIRAIINYLINSLFFYLATDRDHHYFIRIDFETKMFRTYITVPYFVRIKNDVFDNINIELQSFLDKVQQLNLMPRERIIY